MKRVVLSLFFTLSFLNAGVFDNIFGDKKAKDAFSSGDYAKSAQIYSNIKGDKALYNKGVSLYKDGNFVEALRAFGGVSDPNLEFEKLYNLGNTFVNLGRLHEAKFSYESALKIRDDEDAKFNLDLVTKELEKEKEGEEKDPQQRDDQTEDSRQDGYNDNNQTDPNDRKDDTKDGKSTTENEEEESRTHNQYSGSQNQEKDKNKKDAAQIEKEKQSDSNSDFLEAAKANKEKRLEASKEQGEKDTIDEKEEPKNDEPIDTPLENKEAISDMELRKWERSLDKRGLNTRMLKLDTKGDRVEDLKPW